MISHASLTEIFEHQAALARKFHPIEFMNGYTPPAWPVNIQSRHGQDRLRQFAWWITEEITEALTAPEELFGEELADILHFSVEICLISGIIPETVLNHGVARNLDPSPEPQSLTEVLIELGRGINLLKAKPWKKDPKPTDPDMLIYHLSKSLFILLGTIRRHQFDPSIIYFAKKKVNEQRISDGV